jgi:glycine/sarcosine N-methyltransferase
MDFYDNLAEEYHLIFDDWNNAILWQGEVLNQFIRSKLPHSNMNISLLDCSCGIGTQAIGLAKKEAESSNVEINFEVADFRSLETDVYGDFNVVLSADNAISHLLSDEDVLLAAQNMYSKLKDEGVFLGTLKDYDELIREKPTATQPRIFDNGKRIVFQLWDWYDDTKIYALNHFIIQETNGEWKTKHNKTKYRALLRREFSEVLSKVGFSGIEWYMPEESGYYQPFVLALKKR